MAYVSQKIVSELNDIYATAVKEDWIDDEDFKAAQPLIDTLVTSLTNSSNSFAFSLANEELGLQFAHNTPLPTKHGELLQSLVSMEDYDNEPCGVCEDEEEFDSASLSTQLEHREQYQLFLG